MILDVMTQFPSNHAFDNVNQKEAETKINKRTLSISEDQLVTKPEA